jgi:endoglucanase
MIIATLFGVLVCILTATLAAGQPPEVLHVGTVAPDIIGITIQAGHIEYGRQIPYERGNNDEVRADGKERMVFRDGRFLGWLVGRDGALVYTEDQLLGDPLNTEAADATDHYRIVSSDDAGFSAGVVPVAVYRKSKPSDFGRDVRWIHLFPVRHLIYLKLAKPLTPRCHYRLELPGQAWAAQSFCYDPSSLRSEAVHVSQIGFRPDDPAKRAFLSCWLGSGGPLKYPESTKFWLIDQQTDDVVYEGTTHLAKAGSDESEDAYHRNYAGVDVLEMDFSRCAEPGVYRVSVEGVGCSYPFTIDGDAWKKAFTVSARGFYHQRSGIELGPPCTDFLRPRSFHAADGLRVLESSCPLMDSGNGLNARGTDRGNFGNLVQGKMQSVVPDAWGGYMDAGDWDRRIQHLIVTRYLIELAELFPDYFDRVTLNIPESSNALPDVVDEGLFNLDCYRRMQTAEGGIRGGIESSEHPRHGEASWQESLDVMAYAPDVWSSYLYTGVAAQAAHWLSTRDASLAATYRTSALRAMQWAQQEYAQLQQSQDWAAIKEDARRDIRDARNLAAAELYRLTGDDAWHRVFLSTTKFSDPKAELAVWSSHDQTEAAWVYARTDQPGIQATIQENCRQALRRQADDRIRSVERSGFRIAKDAWRPGAWGAFAAPDAVSLVRAHAIAGETRYLEAAVLACQHGAGANPCNTCYTTGLGHESPQHPLHIDSRITHQAPPAGLTVFGPADVQNDKDNWAQKIVAQSCYPDVQQWPTLEAFWDVFWYPSICEFTVQSPMAANAYVWGYLAARAAEPPSAGQ